MRVLSTEMKYLKRAARLLNRDFVIRRGLDLCIEVLWVSVGQRKATGHQSSRFEKKILLILSESGLNRAEEQNFF